MRRTTPRRTHPIEKPPDLSRRPSGNGRGSLETIESEENVARVRDAMTAFVRRGDRERFAAVVAQFVRCARGRGETIEHVLGTLETLADSCEGTARGGFAERDTPLRRLTLRSVLVNYYGSEAVARETSARDRRLAERRGSRGVGGA